MDDSYERMALILSKAIEELDKRHSQIKKAITNFKKQGAGNDPYAAYRWLKANEDLMSKESPALLDVAEEFEHICKDLLLKLEADLREAFSAEGWSFSGQWPKYHVEYFLPVVIDEGKFSVAVGDDKLPTLDIKKVIASVKTELNKLKPDHNELPAFLQEMHHSYSRLVEPRSPTVSIWDVYRDIIVQRQPRKLWRDANAASFRPFRELEFKALLTGLLKANMTTITGLQLRLHPPVMKDESMYIYQPIENRFCHVGRIEFMADSGEGGGLD